MWSAKSVLVPIDFSTASFAALDEALKIVDDPAHVHAIHVLPELNSEADFIREALDREGQEARARAALLERLAQPRFAGVRGIIKTGVAGEVIAATARELGCDLIVMPSHGRRGLSRLMLGSVAERVLRLASCPILILRTAPATS